MANKIEKPIDSLDTSWEGYVGKQVEAFIKKMFGLRFGYTQSTSDNTGLTTVRFFSDEDACSKWASDPVKHAELLLSKVEFYSSGSVAADYTLAARITRQPAETIVKGSSNVVRFTYNSYYGGDPNDLDSQPGTLRVTVNATEIPALGRSLLAGGAEYEIDLGPYLMQESNAVQITVSNAHGKSRQWSFVLSTREILLRLDDSFEESLVRGAGWTLRAACSGTTADVHLVIDDDLQTEQIATVTNSTVDFLIDAHDSLAYGAHTISIYAANAEFGIITDTIRTSFIKRGLSTPSVCIGTKVDRSAKLYGTASIPYFFYFPTGNAGEVVPVQLEVRSTTGELLAVAGSQQVILDANRASGKQEWRLTLSDSAWLGEVVPTVVVGGVSAGYTLHVAEAGVSLEAAPECKVYLSAAGRTNADSDAEDWHAEYNGQRTCTVLRSPNFALTGDNGFQGDGFRIKAGKSITLSGFQPFAADFGANATDVSARTGKTLEFEFETANCTDASSPVISCLRDGVGFVVYPNRVELHCAAGMIHTLYCDEQRVRVCFCIDGTTTTCVNDTGNSEQGSTTTYCNICYLYVNGVIVRMMNYDASAWVQSVPQEIIVGSPDCDVTLYTVRSYDKSLTYRQMLGNYAFDTPDLEEKIAIARRNDILDSSGAVSLAKVQEALPKTPRIIWDIENLPTSKKDPRPCDKTAFTNPSWDGSDNAMASFTIGLHEINGDGTSSNNYPLPYKNWAEKYECADPNGWVLHLPAGDVVITKFSITPGVDAGETEFVHKVNFASCEGIFNMLAMNMYQQILVATATATSGYPDLLTAQQAAQEAAGEAITCRQSLSGFPEIGFRRTYDENGVAKVAFLSIYNFINNKYSPSIFGFSKKSEKNQIWEVDDNINFFMQRIDPAVWNDSGFDSTATTLYYARVPKKSLVTGEKFGVAAASNQLSQANAETEALRRIHNWLWSCNPTVAERYRLRYGAYRPLSIEEDGYTNYTHGDDTYTVDTPAYRYAKFASEYAQYLNKWNAIFYFIFLTYHLGTDSMDKNMSLACEDVTAEHATWKIFIRDTDTTCLFNNSGILRWRYFHEWGDSFDATTEQTGRVTGESYDPVSGSYTAQATVGTPIFNGRLSGLWDCVSKVWSEEIKTMYVSMRSNGLNFATLFGKYIAYWSHWCESLYNVDGMGYANTGNFAMAYGDKLELVRYFYKYRQRYWDSKCATGESSSNVLMMRLWRRGDGVALRHACALYASLNWGSGGVKSQRNIEAGTPSYFENGITASGANEVTFSIYDADLLTEISTYRRAADGSVTEAGLEGLGELDIQTNLPKCRRLKRLILAYTAAEPNNNLSNSGFDLSSCTMLREIVVTNCRSLTRAVTVASEMVERIDFRGTPIVGITLPPTDSLVELRLPATIQRLQLADLSGLSNLTVEGADAMTIIRIVGCPQVNSQAVIEVALNRTERLLTEVEIDGIAWTEFSIDHLLYLASIGARLTGTIDLATSSSSTLTSEQKQAIMVVYGDIDDPENALYVNYVHRNLNSLAISGPNYIRQAGDYAYSAIPQPASANYFAPVTWSISDETYATIDAVTGVLTLKQDSLVGQPSAVITASTMRLNDRVRISATKRVGFYNRMAAVGDYAFADGTFDDVRDVTKAVVGVVYQVDDAADGVIRVVGCADFARGEWGISTKSDPEGDLNELTNYKTYDGSNSSIAPDADWSSIYLQNGYYRTFANGALSDWDGQQNTEKIIAYRNELLLAADVEIPETMTELDTLYNTLGADTTTDRCLRLYRAASICHLYRPEVSGALAAGYEQGKWYLPADGELARIYWAHRQGYVTPTEMPDNAVLRPIFAAACNSLNSYGNSLFPQFEGTPYWTSTECNYENAWKIVFGTGENWVGHKTAPYSKARVRPCCAISKQSLL